MWSYSIIPVNKYTDVMEKSNWFLIPRFIRRECWARFFDWVNTWSRYMMLVLAWSWRDLLIPRSSPAALNRHVTLREPIVVTCQRFPLVSHHRFREFLPKVKRNHSTGSSLWKWAINKNLNTVFSLTMYIFIL